MQRVRSVTMSSKNGSPEARKDWPGCSSSIDGYEDEVVVNGAVEDISSFHNDPPKARKDWPGCSSGVDGEEDEVVVGGVVEDVGDLVQAAGKMATT
jgi:hypothetical protein